MISGTVHSINVELALAQLGKDVRAAVASELDVLAQKTARLMKMRAPKFSSTLTNAVYVISTSELEREIAPGVDYAPYVEDGIKPGGKGLPRYMDPKSKSIVDWLQSKAPSHFVGPISSKNKRNPRKGSRVIAAVEMQLRDRYEGLAWHVRHHGVKAQPFVKPARDEMEPQVKPALEAAVRAAMRALAASTGSTA